MKKNLYIFLIASALLIVFISIMSFVNFKDTDNTLTKDPILESFDFNLDTKNMTYVIEGEIFEMKNGIAEITYPDSEIKNTLISFDQPTYGDLDSDGDNDAVIWLVNDPGGTGKFYYAVLAINIGTEYKATNVILLGDRIAPQPILILNGQAVYNFKERKLEDPMTAEPTVSKSVVIKYNKETGEISI